MRDSRKSILGFLLIAVIAFGMTVPSLPAAPMGGAKFKLTFDSQWGKVALPTGEYELRFHPSLADGTIILYQGAKGLGIVRPEVIDRQQNQGSNPVLICFRHDGKTAVRALRVPNVGTFYYSLPKELQGLMAKEPKLIETISVEVSGQ